jgi:hypothetical protein
MSSHGCYLCPTHKQQPRARASHEELAAHFGTEEFFDSWIAGECEHDFPCRFDIQAKVQKWTAPPFKRDPFAEGGEIKSGRIKPELESIGEFAAPDYRSRDRAQNPLPPILLLGRQGIQIAYDWEAGFAHVHVPALFDLGARADSGAVFLSSSAAGGVGCVSHDHATPKGRDAALPYFMALI